MFSCKNGLTFSSSIKVKKCYYCCFIGIVCSCGCNLNCKCVKESLLVCPVCARFALIVLNSCLLLIIGDFSDLVVVAL